VVDGSHADPEGQLAAVREVFAEIGADKVPELVVINKADIADPLAIDRLRRRERHSVVVSARTGEGFDELRTLIARELPRPSVAIEVLLPYGRGDLVSRIHDDGDLLEEEHTPEGTRMRALVTDALAGELSPYSVMAVDTSSG
jgi:GTP-binding protein HflX